MSALRLAFMGSPDFSVPVLDALIEAGHQVACVYAQPPRPAGRGHHEHPCPVHARAAELGLAVRTPASLKGEAEQAAFRALELDVAVVSAYGLILPRAVLTAPRLGCVNVHASLLPRWRGAAPIQRAIEAGDRESGVTIMQMDEGLDTGAMLLTERVRITPAMDAGALHDALSILGARLVVEALEGLEAGTLTPVPQPEDGATYARKLDKAEGMIDWTRPAEDLARQVRALTPWPGTWCIIHGERVKILAAEVAPGEGEPGTVLDDALTVACGRDALRATRVQRSGKGAMAASEMLRGRPVPRGTVVGGAGTPSGGGT
ncbi:MAG: methionyl-tRNA formyltransferase [Rhodobacterales bacterium]|nr:methionyl-tRNA formyltransferase [Rhodobacterales bacterium]